MTSRSSSTTKPSYPHHQHRLHNQAWLRAAVLGANDGILSTTSLLIGVAAAGGGLREILVAGMASLVAGAMSMATGEYVSVSSQADMEAAELSLEKQALQHYPEEECEELRNIYVERGLSPALATQVARELMAHDALGAHARDDIGLTDISQARPLLAAVTSGLTFSAGAALPLLAAVLLPFAALQWGLAAAALFFLTLLGAVAAQGGGAPMLKGALRVGFWGALAMALSALVGRLFGVMV